MYMYIIYIYIYTQYTYLYQNVIRLETRCQKKTNQTPNKSIGLATRNPSNQLLTQYDPTVPRPAA